MRRSAVLARTCALATIPAALLLTGCASDVPPLNCEIPDAECFIGQAVKGLRAVRENISYWSNVNLLGQVLIVVSGVVATVMIALQGDLNKYWTRPVGLIATALVTGITSALISFHVPENVDKLVDILDSMTTTVNDYDYKISKLRDGKSAAEATKVYGSDAKFREAVNTITKDYVDSYNKLKIDMLKLNGTAARLNSIAPPPSSTAQPKPVPK